MRSSGLESRACPHIMRQEHDEAELDEEQELDDEQRCPDSIECHQSDPWVVLS